MTFPIQFKSLSRLEATFPIVVKNTHSSTAPAYAILEITGVTNYGTDTIYDVSRPTGSADAKYVINGPDSIVNDAYGAATNQYPANVAYDTGATPALNEDWGPVSGSWLLTKSGTGWIILGGHASGIVRVAASGGSNMAVFTADISSTIAAGSAGSPTSGSGTVYRINSDGSATNLGAQDLWNPFEIGAVGSATCQYLGGGQYLLTGIIPPCSSLEVVTGFQCVDDVLTADTVDLMYFSCG
jgi:hypothetical protein